MKKKIALVVGTRPEIIKLAPVMKELERRHIPFLLIHSNQHYSPSMDKVFFETLGLPNPDYNLNAGQGTQAEQTCKIMLGIEKIFLAEKQNEQAGIEVVIVQGDTNTVMAAALTASKLGIKVAHVEAGLRSYDRGMPEEINRIITDHIADYLFAVSPVQQKILENEGIHAEKVHIVGNTIVDALYYAQDLLKANPQPELNFSSSFQLDKYQKQSFFLLTAHRPSNVDTQEGLAEILEICRALYKKYGLPVLWPMHPRTRGNVDKFKLTIDESLHVIEPIGYLEFNYLMNEAYCILTDSGGIQEEACVLQVPCITLRENTERPESVSIGANVLTGRNLGKIEAALEFFHHKKLKGEKWHNPFGDGKTSAKIIEALIS